METLGMTPLKVGEPFLDLLDGNPEPSQDSSRGRCRDWTGGTYGARHGEGTVQTTNVSRRRRRKPKWQVNPQVVGSIPTGPT